MAIVTGLVLKQPRHSSGAILGRLTVFVYSVFVVRCRGDVNDRLHQPAAAHRFNQLVIAYGLLGHVRTATHFRECMLDTVARRVDLLPPVVELLDVIAGWITVFFDGLAAARTFGASHTSVTRRP